MGRGLERPHNTQPSVIPPEGRGSFWKCQSPSTSILPCLFALPHFRDSFRPWDTDTPGELGVVSGHRGDEASGAWGGHLEHLRQQCSVGPTERHACPLCHFQDDRVGGDRCSRSQPTGRPGKTSSMAERPTCHCTKIMQCGMGNRIGESLVLVPGPPRHHRGKLYNFH